MVKINSHEHTLTTSYLLFLITTILSHPKSIFGASNYLSHDCQNSITFSPNSSYQSNLKALLASLYSAGARGNDFYYATAGRMLPDVVFGLFLCRADAAACRQCVANASEVVVRRCPAEKEAVIWYDQCMLRYSNQPILAIPSLTPAKFLPGRRDTGPAVSGKQGNDQSELLLDSMVTAMVAKAANSGLNRKFAAAEQNLTDSETVYGLAQCTPNLSAEDCSKCFMSAKDAMRTCCGGQRSARLLLPSCYVMYDDKLFFNATMLDTPLPPPPPPGKSNKTSSIVIASSVVPIVSIVLILASGYYFLRWRAKKKYNALITQENCTVNDSTNIDSLQFNFRSIQVATSKFSDHNMLGKGGFGEVYKGTLLGGRDIAVKRLSKSSVQGSAEFKNEVVLLAKLQHRNLVRLLGFCLERDEKLLVYEFVPNKSLDYFLFDPKKQDRLNWSIRRNIVEGIARGVMYLHEDSRLKIIHRDLKASNILLDNNMNAKVSDFGMAKMFGGDQTQGNTNRIVGTYGYMAPEYAMEGLYSIKSDVFSFGVLLLEILSGRRNTSFHISDCAPSLISYAWQLWNERKALDLMDPCLKDSCHPNEFLRYVQIGLLCVQEDASLRPTMSSVVLTLKSEAQSLSQPEKPAFINARRSYTSHQEIIHVNSCSVNGITVSDFLPR